MKKFKWNLSIRETLIFVLCLAFSAGFLLWLPKSFDISQNLEISSEKVLDKSGPTALKKTKALLQTEPIDCQIQSSSLLTCRGSYASKQAALNGFVALAKLGQIGRIPREALVDRMEVQLKSIERTRSEINRINDQSFQLSSNLEVEESVESLRSEKLLLEDQIRTYAQQLELVEEGLVNQNSAARLDIFQQKQQDLKEKIAERKAKLSELMPKYNAEAGPQFAQLDQMEQEKSELKVQLEEHLLLATDLEEYLQAHKNQDRIADPEDLQVTPLPESQSLEIQRLSYVRLLWLPFLSCFLFGLWLKLGSVFKLNIPPMENVFAGGAKPKSKNKGSSKANSGKLMEETLGIRFLGDLREH